MNFAKSLILAVLLFMPTATPAANWDALCFSPMTVEKLREMEAHLKDQITTNVGLDVVSVQIVPVGGEPPQFEIRVLYRTNEPGAPSGTTDTMVIPFHCGE